MQALRNTNITPSKNSLRLGFLLSMVVFLLALIGGIIFILTLEDVSEWWFDGAFFGGLLGGLFTSVFLYFAMKNIHLK